MMTIHNDLTVEKFTNTMTRLEARSTGEIADWNADFIMDPLYALEWSDKVFVAAADQFVARHMLKACEKCSLDEIIEIVRKRVMIGASNPPRSSSSSSNLMKIQETAAYARTYDILTERY